MNTKKSQEPRNQWRGSLVDRDNEQPTRRRALGAYIIGATLVVALVSIYHLSTWDSVRAFVVAIDHCEKLFCDFTNHYYPMGNEILQTRTPVGGYFYSPFFAILLAPLGSLSLSTALSIWGAVQGLLLVGLLAVPGWIFLRESPISFYIYIFLTAASLPILHNLKWGQVSVLMTLCALAALILSHKRHPIAAGVVLAFGTWIKYYPALFLIIFLIKRDLRFLAAFSVASLILGLIVPLGLLGIPEGLRFYERVSQAVREAQGWVVEDANSQYVAHVARRLTGDEVGGTVQIAATWFGYLIVACNVLTVFILMRKEIERYLTWAYIFLFVSLPFLISTSWPHYFVFLPFCQAVLAHSLLTSAEVRWIKLLKGGLLLLPSVFISSAFFFNIVGDWIVYSTFGALFFANLFILVLAYLQIIPQLKMETRHSYAVVS